MYSNTNSSCYWQYKLYNRLRWNTVSSTIVYGSTKSFKYTKRLTTDKANLQKHRSFIRLVPIAGNHLETVMVYIIRYSASFALFRKYFIMCTCINLYLL